MVTIYTVKSENNILKSCHNPNCNEPFKNGQRVVRTVTGKHGHTIIFHIEHYVDAHGEQIYE